MLTFTADRLLLPGRPRLGRHRRWGHPASLTAMLNYYRALRERKKPDPPARIQLPTLVLWGEHDAFLEHHVARAALGLCDNGQLFIIQGVTHRLHLEEPNRLNAEGIQFLGSEAKGSVG